MLTTVLTQQNVNNHLVILLTEKEERGKSVLSKI